MKSASSQYDRREKRLAATAFELAAAVGAALPERRRVEARPHPRRFGTTIEHPAVRRQHAPHFAQQRRTRSATSRQWTPSRRSTELSGSGSDPRRRAPRRTRPPAARRGRPARRHQRRQPRGFAAKGAEVGRGKAEATTVVALAAPPAGANAMRQAAARHLPEGRGVEIRGAERRPLHVEHWRALSIPIYKQRHEQTGVAMTRQPLCVLTPYGTVIRAHPRRKPWLTLNPPVHVPQGQFRRARSRLATGETRGNRCARGGAQAPDKGWKLTHILTPIITRDHTR